MSRRWHAWLSCVVVSCAACGVSHIGSNTARHREYEPGAYGGTPAPVSEGSLWQDTNRGLFADFRASRLGDVVTIRIDESATASGAASTDLSHDGAASFGMPSMLGFMSSLARHHPDIDPSSLFDMMSESSSSSDGDTSRHTQARAAIAVRVSRVLPNGDLFVEGTKVLMINIEELHVYVSGVIRPEDIGPDNAISSSMVADAEIEFTGSGDLTRNQTPGWMSRLMQRGRPL